MIIAMLGLTLSLSGSSAAGRSRRCSTSPDGRVTRDETAPVAQRSRRTANEIENELASALASRREGEHVVTLEIILMWTALTFYVASTVMFVFGVIFSKETLTRRAVLGRGDRARAADRRARGALGCDSATGPTSATTRSRTRSTLCTVAFFVVAALRNPRLERDRASASCRSRCCCSAARCSRRRRTSRSPPALASYWLFIHVAFANLAFAAFAASFGLARRLRDPGAVEDGHVGASASRSCPLRTSSTTSPHGSCSPASCSGAS